MLVVLLRASVLCVLICYMLCLVECLLFYRLLAIMMVIATLIVVCAVLLCDCLRMETESPLATLRPRQRQPQRTVAEEAAAA